MSVSKVLFTKNKSNIINTSLKTTIVLHKAIGKQKKGGKQLSKILAQFLQLRLSH